MPEVLSCPYCKEPTDVVRGRLATHNDGKRTVVCIGSGEDAGIVRDLNSAHAQLRNRMEWRGRKGRR